MKESSSLALLRKILDAPLPMRVAAGTNVDQLIAYEAAGFIKIELGPVSKERSTFGHRADSFILAVTRAGRRALGQA